VPRSAGSEWRSAARQCLGDETFLAPYTPAAELGEKGHMPDISRPGEGNRVFIEAGRSALRVPLFTMERADGAMHQNGRIRNSEPVCETTNKVAVDRIVRQYARIPCSR